MKHVKITAKPTRPKSPVPPKKASKEKLPKSTSTDSPPARSTAIIKKHKKAKAAKVKDVVMKKAKGKAGGKKGTVVKGRKAEAACPK